MPEADEWTSKAYDNYISAEVLLPKGDILVPAHVVSRKRDTDGNPAGVANTNPLLDTRVYNVEFSDGHQEEYAANIIAENIFAQVDPEGNQYLLLDEITGHHSDSSALEKKDMWIQNGANRSMRQTTAGWYLQVSWKNGVRYP